MKKLLVSLALAAAALPAQAQEFTMKIGFAKRCPRGWETPLA